MGHLSQDAKLWNVGTFGSQPWLSTRMSRGSVEETTNAWVPLPELLM